MKKGITAMGSDRKKKMEQIAEKRRTIRIRRSSLVTSKLSDIDRPSIKIAETKTELSQAFKIVYKEYFSSGYVKDEHPSEMLYDIYSLLPTTSVFVFKSFTDVLSTMSLYDDNDHLGLPLDALYKDKVDELRGQGRRVAEIGALATPKRRRSLGIMIYLSKAVFNYLKINHVNDVCITVNPKHTRFYRDILLFKDFGEERTYGKVGAPAVLLRVDFDEYAEKLDEIYGENEFDTDLSAFFSKVNNRILDPNIIYSTVRNRPLDYDAARYFFAQRPEIFDSLTSSQLKYLTSLYNKALFAEGSVVH